jgi:hypothetical protein
MSYYGTAHAVKNCLKYFTLILFATIWVVSCVPVLRKAAVQTGMIPDDYRYGDLYRLSNLVQFKEEVSSEKRNGAARAGAAPAVKNELKQPTTKEQALYIIGDSFTESDWIAKTDFQIDTLVHVPWYKTQSTRLDSTKNNILILESVERHFREHFAKPVENIRLDGYQAPETNLMQDVEKTLNTIEEILESMWLSGDFFLAFKELKAKLNDHFFDRTNQQVSLSNDKQQLLFDLDTDSTKINSCFNQLTDNELDKLVEMINKTSDYYKKRGFKAVYLSVIPNKTSIVAANDGLYNHLVERVQKHPNLSVPTIDVWVAFNKNPTKIYLKGDSHWNSYGRNIWVEKANKLVYEK